MKHKIILILVLVLTHFLLITNLFAQKLIPPPPAVFVKADGKQLKRNNVDNKINSSVQGVSILYSHGEPTDEEQLMLEYINRARANPKAEGERLYNTKDPEVLSSVSYFNINLTQIKNEFAGYPARPPLAMNKQLIDAARVHCEDMGANNFQAHEGSDGSGPGDRISRAGYAWSTYGENIFAYMKNVWHGHCGFNIDWGNADPGHRKNIMNYVSDNMVFREVGIGIIHKSGGSTGPLICTEDFGTSVDYFVLGVVYKDKNGNQFYDIGEGLAGVNISLNKGSYSAVTSKSGGYAIPLSNITGSLTVTASGGGLVETQTRIVSVKKDVNVKVDFGNPVAYEPFVLQPPNNSSIPIDSLRFIWQKNNSVPTTFTFQCAKDANFTQIFYADSNKTDTFKVLKNLVLYQTYYWRVRAKNQYGYSDYTPPQTFKYTLSPSIVTVLEPSNGYETLKDTIKFIWNKATPNIQSYSLEVYEDSACTKLYTFKTNIIDTTVTISGFDYGNLYWWKVKAKNQGGFGDFGNSNWFQYGKTPSTILKMKPANDSYVPLINIEFSWESTKPASTKYSFEIYEDSTMQEIPIYFTTMLTDTFKQSEFDWGLENGKSYFWRVRGVIGNLKGNWSPLSKINTGFKPPAVSNLTPANGAIVSLNKLKFSWTSPATAPDKYWFEINEDSTFQAQPTYFVPSQIVSSATANQSWGLLNKKTYWWRVKNSLNAIWSNWSVPYKFTLDNDIQSVNDEKNNLNLELTNNLVIDKLKFNFSASKNYKHICYKIINSNGDVVLSQVLQNFLSLSNEISLTNLTSGKYIFVLEADNFIQSKEFLILR